MRRLAVRELAEGLFDGSLENLRAFLAEPQALALGAAAGEQMESAAH